MSAPAPPPVPHRPASVIAPEPGNEAPNATPRPLSLGAALGRTLSAWGRDAPKFAALFLVVNVPFLAFGAWFFASPDAWAERSNRGWAAVAIVVGGLIDLVAVGAVVEGAYGRLVGRPEGLLGCLRRGVTRFASLVGVALRIALRVVMVGLLLSLPFTFLVSVSRMRHGQSSGREVSDLAGPVAALIALLVVLSQHGTALAACVVERSKASVAMSRAGELQRGSRWSIGGLVALTMGGRFAVGRLVAGLLRPRGGAFVEAPLRDAFEAAWRTVLVTEGIAILIVGPLLAVALAVVYHDLRRAREGVGAADVGRVFE